MIYINNHVRKTLKASLISAGPDPTPNSYQATLAELIQRCVEAIPPRELSRCLRDFFFMYLMDMKKIPTGFQKQMLDLMVLFEELDKAEQE